MNPGPFCCGMDAQCGCFHTKDRPWGGATQLFCGCSFQSPETEMSGKRLERFWIPPGLRDSLQSFAALFAGVGSLTFYKSLLNGTLVRELAWLL